MEFSALLTNRRAIRDFQERDIPLSLIQEIIQDTCLAPTASNGQPCRFIIIRNRGLMKKLSDESKRNLLELIRNPALPMKQYEEKLRNEQFNVFYNAPCLIFIIGSRDVVTLREDCGLTAAYLMFSAASRGLGTCWIGLGSYIRDRKILEEIGVPEGFRIVAPLILGYPARIPPAPERRAPEIVKVI